MQVCNIIKYEKTLKVLNTALYFKKFLVSTLTILRVLFFVVFKYHIWKNNNFFLSRCFFEFLFDDLVLYSVHQMLFNLQNENLSVLV